MNWGGRSTEAVDINTSCRHMLHKGLALQLLKCPAQLRIGGFGFCAVWSASAHGVETRGK